MAIIKESLSASYTDLEPIYNFLKTYAEGIYFDSVVYDSDTPSVSCYIGESIGMMIGVNTTYSCQTMTIYKSTGGTLINKNIGAHSDAASTVVNGTVSIKYFKYGYSCNNGIFLSNEKYGTATNLGTYKTGAPISITKDANGNTCIIMSFSPVLNYSVGYLKSVAGHPTYNSPINLMTYSSLDFSENSSSNSSFYYYSPVRCANLISVVRPTISSTLRYNPKFSYFCNSAITTLAPMPVLDSSENHLPNAYWIVDRQEASHGALTLNGKTYLSNGIWCILDE